MSIANFFLTSSVELRPNQISILPLVQNFHSTKVSATRLCRGLITSPRVETFVVGQLSQTFSWINFLSYKFIFTTRTENFVCKTFSQIFPSWKLPPTKYSAKLGWKLLRRQNFVSHKYFPKLEWKLLRRTLLTHKLPIENFFRQTSSLVDETPLANFLTNNFVTEFLTHKYFATHKLSRRLRNFTSTLAAKNISALGNFRVPTTNQSSKLKVWESWKLKFIRGFYQAHSSRISVCRSRFGVGWKTIPTHKTFRPAHDQLHPPN